ncbi:MAG: NTP transferase domain-containing protein [Nautiliaceae bacterium]
MGYSKETNIPCFILVGGKSSRFKKDKSKLFYKSQYKKCKKLFKNVYFVAKEKKFKNYPFFIEKSKTYAPVFALKEIIKKHKKVFVLSVDTPFVDIKSLQKLLKQKAVAKDNPLIGYYDYTMLKNFTSLRVFPINPKKTEIKNTFNINTQEEFKKIKPLLNRSRF